MFWNAYCMYNLKKKYFNYSILYSSKYGVLSPNMNLRPLCVVVVSTVRCVTHSTHHFSGKNVNFMYSWRFLMTLMTQFPSTNFYKILKNERSIHPIVISRKKLRKKRVIWAYLCFFKANIIRFKWCKFIIIKTFFLLFFSINNTISLQLYNFLS